MTTAVEVLRQHNRWRRGEDIPQQDPKRIGEAIDSVCNQVETCASQCEATACRIELQRLRACAARVIEAFESLGRATDATGLLTARARCETELLKLRGNLNCEDPA